MNNRLLRPCITACATVVALLMRTLAGDSLVTQDGFNLKAIQDA